MIPIQYLFEIDPGKKKQHSNQHKIKKIIKKRQQSIIKPKLTLSDNKIYYRCGPIQNIKTFEPKVPITAHNSNKTNKLVYVTNDPSYAAGFCFDYAGNDDIEFGRINNKQWTLEIPKMLKHKLNGACSMYYLKGNCLKIPNITTPEYYSTQTLTVIKEVKFKTCYECLDKYNVKLVIK